MLRNIKNLLKIFEKIRIGEIIPKSMYTLKLCITWILGYEQNENCQVYLFTLSFLIALFL